MTAILIGYAHCSTDKQDLEANRQILLGLGVSADQIYLDRAYSGTTRARPSPDQALAAVRAGDTLVVLRHLEPERANALDVILGKRTALPVSFAVDGDQLTAGRVRIAPPGQHTVIASDTTVALIAAGAAPPSRPESTGSPARPGSCLTR